MTVEGAIHIDVGDIRCTVISDGALTTSASFLFANAADEELQPILFNERLRPESITAGLNTLLIETGEARILQDAGLGAPGDNGLGKVPEPLEQLGVDRESIDIVLISHCHPDHIGGLVDGRGGLRYPQARYLMHRAEWQYWTDERELRRLKPSWAKVAASVLPRIADVVELVDDEQEVGAGVRLVPAPGHTPGHLGLLVESRGERLLGVGDAIGHPLAVRRPEWLVGSDGDAPGTIATRRRLIRMAAELPALVFANHFVFPGLGRIRPAADGHVWKEGPG